MFIAITLAGGLVFLLGLGVWSVLKAVGRRMARKWGPRMAAQAARNWAEMDRNIAKGKALRHG